MEIFIFTFIALVVFVIAMSAGVLMGGKPVAGSCGGIGAALGEKDYTCDICGGDPNKCDEQTADSIGSSLAYDADKK
jgi:hypothetical protein